MIVQQVQSIYSNNSPVYFLEQTSAVVFWGNMVVIHMGFEPIIPGWIIDTLTLTMLYFLNGIILLLFLELFIIIFKDIKMRAWSWSANSIEPG